MSASFLCICYLCFSVVFDWGKDCSEFIDKSRTISERKSREQYGDVEGVGETAACKNQHLN